MAQSKQALRSRIRSIKNTRKITKAMEMIANAKLFKQRRRMEENREYAGRLHATVNAIMIDCPDVEAKYVIPKKSEERLTVVFCSDLGLCGAYNANIFNYAREHLSLTAPVLLIGTSLYHEFAEYGFRLLQEEPLASDKMTALKLKKILQRAMRMYEADEIGVVQLLYTRFVNTMTFTPVIEQLLPAMAHAEDREPEKGERVLTLFEPDPVTILDQLIPMMIENVTYAAWMETTTAEQGSRRVAMKTASDNADSLSDTLLLAYNKARQAAITQEITEVVNGSNAV